MKRLLGTTALTAMMAAAVGTAHAQSEYCAQGWMSADTNADGIVDADEREAANAGIYSGYDIDGDGVVTRDEYSECAGATQMGERTPGDEESFMSVDANGDGFISADEYRATAHGAYQQSLETDDEAARAERDRWMGSTEASGSAELSADQAASSAARHFRSFDEDGDGQVSREEWTGVSDDENASAGAQGAHFDSMDENMDGQLTMEEYSAARGTAYDSARASAEAEGVDVTTGVPVYHYRFYVY